MANGIGLVLYVICFLGIAVLIEILWFLLNFVASAIRSIFCKNWKWVVLSKRRIKTYDSIIDWLKNQLITAIIILVVYTVLAVIYFFVD